MEGSATKLHEVGQKNFELRGDTHEKLIFGSTVPVTIKCNLIAVYVRKDPLYSGSHPGAAISARVPARAWHCNARASGTGLDAANT